MTKQWIIPVLDEVLVRGVKSVGAHFWRLEQNKSVRPLIKITIMIDDDENYYAEIETVVGIHYCAEIEPFSREAKVNLWAKTLISAKACRGHKR